MLEISDTIRGTTEPDRYWTLTNVSEATPDILSPLCWSVWGEYTDLGTKGGFCDFGIIPARDVRFSGDPNGMITACFFGRQAANVDFCRTLMAGIPGTSADEMELDLLGSVRSDAPPVANSWRRVPFIACKAPYVVVTQTKRITRLHEEYLGWWRSVVLNGASTANPRIHLVAAADRFRRAMRAHVCTRFLIQGLRSRVILVAEGAGVPELAGRVLAGAGGVAEIALAQDLWRVAQGQLSRESFLERHGFHGSAEGNVIGRSWREEPALVDALAAALAARTDSREPRLREQQAVLDRQRAEVELNRRLSRTGRGTAKMLYRLAGTHTRNLELGKACLLMALDGCRAAARRLGADLVASGVFDDVEDVFYLTLPELLDGPPEDSRRIIAFRRSRREAYRHFDLPTNFTGMPEPITSGAVSHGDPGVVVGTPGSAGVVEGRARVVWEPEEAVALAPGEILVCRYTDPSWSACFTLAEGVVIDLGGAASHGAIVARELGIPCVIGTGDGTARLRTGDLIRVDGSSGRVEIISRAPDSADATAG